MSKPNSSEIKRGQAISFRVPSDTPDHILRHLQKMKETERRNFSSKIAEFVLQGVGSSYKRERETITIPLPHKLSKSQRDWVKHEHSEALLGSIVYHLLTNPVRATALLASLNSSALEINEALYLQEEPEDLESIEGNLTVEKPDPAIQPETIDDDLSSFDWETAKKETGETEDADGNHGQENDLESLLGDFLSSMNK